MMQRQRQRQWRRRWLYVGVMLLVGAALLTGCGGSGDNAPPPQVAAPATEATQEPAPVAPAATADVGATGTESITETVTASMTGVMTEVATGVATETVTATTIAGPGAVPLDVPEWIAFSSVYSDAQAGIELRYPFEWTLLDTDPAIKAESTGYAVTLNSWETPADGGGDGIPVGGTKIDILINRSDAANAQEAAEQRRRDLAESDPDATITNETTVTLEDGSTAIRWTITGGQMDVAELITVSNGYTVILAGLGDFILFDEVASTLRTNVE